jgi:hypothetical protein
MALWEAKRKLTGLQEIYIYYNVKLPLMKFVTVGLLLWYSSGQYNCLNRRILSQDQIF